jgi:small subunit ribosomal protein S11
MAEEIKIEDEKKETAENAENLAVEGEVKEKAADTDAKKKKKLKIKRQVSRGKANVKCTYNNTMVTITDMNGGVLAWATSGLLNFKGAKKATPYAATQVVGNISEKVRKFGVKELEVYVRGVGSGREASVRALANNGFDLVLIKDITPIPHNGCRPKKPRRV